MQHREYFAGGPAGLNLRSDLLLTSWFAGIFFFFMYLWITSSNTVPSMTLDQTALKQILNLCIWNNAQEVISKKGLCILRVHWKTGHNKTLHNIIISNLYWHYLVSMKLFLSFLVLPYPLIWSYGTKKWIVWFYILKQQSLAFISKLNLPLRKSGLYLLILFPFFFFYCFVLLLKGFSTGKIRLFLFRLPLQCPFPFCGNSLVHFNGPNYSKMYNLFYPRCFTLLYGFWE